MSWWWMGAPKTGKGVPRIYSTHKDATAGANTMTLTLPNRGVITRVELAANNVSEAFKLAESHVYSPRGGNTIRLAHGQLLPEEDARLAENMNVHVDKQSEVGCTFYGMTAAVKLWLQIAILEDE
jgi:hypothetical protein